MHLTPPQREGLRQRILKNVVVDALSGCWLWQRRRNNSGYPTLTFRIPGYDHPVTLLAHRVAYVVFKRMPPAGLHIAHSIKCVSQLCVNPEHLRATSQSGNERDKKRARRWRQRELRELHAPKHFVDHTLIDRREAA
jgi:hypothetical protein